MKTKKLNLNDLKVESFVTSLENKDVQTVKGGNTSLITAISMSVSISAILAFLVVKK